MTVGRISNCPGYVNVKISIWPSSAKYEPIINHDVLISCPPSFSVSFALPVLADDVTQLTVEDCILECVLEDGKSAHRLLLRPIFAPEQQPQAPRENTAIAKTDGDNKDNVKRGSDFDLATFGVAVLLAMSITLTFVWLFSELFHLTKVRQRGRRDRGIRSSAAMSVTTSAPPCSVQFSDSVRRTFTSLRVLMRFIYAFAFTFTVFITLVGVALRQRVDQSSVTARSTLNSKRLTSVEEDSAFAAAFSRWQVASCLVQTSIKLHGAQPMFSRRSAAVADVIVPSVNSFHTAAVRWAQQTTERFLTDVEIAVRRQRRYALMTSLSHWLLFPRALYNTSITTVEKRNPGHAPPQSPQLFSLNSTSKEDAFWNFVQVTPSETELSLWTRNIRER